MATDRDLRRLNDKLLKLEAKLEKSFSSSPSKSLQKKFHDQQETTYAKQLCEAVLVYILALSNAEQPPPASILESPILQCALSCLISAASKERMAKAIYLSELSTRTKAVAPENITQLSRQPSYLSLQESLKEASAAENPSEDRDDSGSVSASETEPLLASPPLPTTISPYLTMERRRKISRAFGVFDSKETGAKETDAEKIRRIAGGAYDAIADHKTAKQKRTVATGIATMVIFALCGCGLSIVPGLLMLTGASTVVSISCVIGWSVLITGIANIFIYKKEVPLCLINLFAKAEGEGYTEGLSPERNKYLQYAKILCVAAGIMFLTLGAWGTIDAFMVSPFMWGLLSSSLLFAGIAIAITSIIAIATLVSMFAITLWGYARILREPKPWQKIKGYFNTPKKCFFITIGLIGMMATMGAGLLPLIILANTITSTILSVLAISLAATLYLTSVVGMFPFIAETMSELCDKVFSAKGLETLKKDFSIKNFLFFSNAINNATLTVPGILAIVIFAPAPINYVVASVIAVFAFFNSIAAAMVNAVNTKERDAATKMKKEFVDIESSKQLNPSFSAEKHIQEGAALHQNLAEKSFLYDLHMEIITPRGSARTSPVDLAPVPHSKNPPETLITAGGRQQEGTPLPPRTGPLPAPLGGSTTQQQPLPFAQPLDDSDDEDEETASRPLGNNSRFRKLWSFSSRTSPRGPSRAISPARLKGRPLHRRRHIPADVPQQQHDDQEVTQALLGPGGKKAQ